MFQWMSKKLNQKRKGFTLIELVVVIAILGILAALAIPRLSGSRDNASRKSILANLRTIDSALTIATSEGKTVSMIEGTPTAPAIALVSDYLAKTPVSIAGEAYSINTTTNRAEVVIEATDLAATRLGAAAGTYTVETLLGQTGWGN